MLARVAAVLGVAAALYCLHLLASWAEDRGWIYYRRNRGRSGTFSGAALQVQSLLQPSAAHVVEERRRRELTRDEAGDDLGEEPAVSGNSCAETRREEPR